MEFATQLAGAPLILVMGHTHCGAVQGACATGGKTGLNNLDYLLSKIQPAVKQSKARDKDLSCKKMADVNQIAKQNVLDQMQYILESSQAINQAVKREDVLVVSAMHDIRTGTVQFFDKKGAPL